MTKPIPVRPGLVSSKVVAIPDVITGEWFRSFIDHYLANSDPRNATILPGMIVTGGINDTVNLGPGAIDPTVTPSQVPPGSTNQGILPHGNVIPMVQNAQFTYTSDNASVTFIWPAYTVYRPDGVTTFAMTSGNQTATGLSASTQYTGYAYSLESAPSTMLFVTGSSGQVGTPAMVFAPSATYAQTSAAFAASNQMSQIFQGKVQGTTTSGGSGGGGGGGGGYGCPHPAQMIETDTGTKIAAELKPGDSINTPDGWAVIRKITRHRHIDWIKVKCDKAKPVLVTKDHRFVDPEGTQIEAGNLHLGSILAGNGKNFVVTQLTLVQEVATAVGLEIDEPHLYYFTKNSPLNHNLKP